MGVREIFKENLKFYRKQKGYTQEKLSELINFGETYITEIESRKKFPKPETIDLIAEKLDIEAYQLFKSHSSEKSYAGQKDLVTQISEQIHAEITENLKTKIFKTISEIFK